MTYLGRCKLFLIDFYFTISYFLIFNCVVLLRIKMLSDNLDNSVVLIVWLHYMSTEFVFISIAVKCCSEKKRTNSILSILSIMLLYRRHQSALLLSFLFRQLHRFSLVPVLLPKDFRCWKPSRFLSKNAPLKYS